MDYPSVSIIISFYGRLGTFERTLTSLSNLDYPSPIEFILIDDASEDVTKAKQLVDKFTDDNPAYYVKFIRNGNKGVNTNILWNMGYKESKNEFVVYCMQDIIPSSKKFIQAMVDSYQNRRVSVVPYYLSHTMTEVMDGVDWKNDARLLETLPGFWTDPSMVNTTRVGANLLCCLTGQYRKDWEYIGLFRDDPIGYLWLDHDLAIREQLLKMDATSVDPKNVCCYHQFHPAQTLTQSGYHYVYRTEREARLLDNTEKVQ